MDRKLKWRTFWLALLTLLAIGTLIPSFVDPRSLPAGFTRVFDKRIQLGLDLQGGLYMVYSIDLDKAVDDKASQIKRDIEAMLDERGIEGRVSTPANPVGAVFIYVDDPANLAKIDGQFLSDYDEIVTTIECPEDREGAGKCLRVSSEYADGIKEAALEQAILTIRDRVNASGLSEPSVKQKGDQIVVEIPGLDKEAREEVKGLIARTAKLEFKIVDEDSAYMKKLFDKVRNSDVAKNLGIEARTDAWVHDDSGKQFQDYYLTAKDRKEVLSIEEAKERGCYDAGKSVIGNEVECLVTGRTLIERFVNQLVAEDESFAVDDDHQLAFERVEPGTGLDDQERDPYWRTYYLLRAVELGGSSVSRAQVSWNPTSNRPETIVTFDRYGGRRFGDLTSKNVGKKMAIILDDRVASAPTIQSAIRGGSSSISMGASDPNVALSEAEDLVKVLKTGSLPAPLRQESETNLGPTLGQDAVSKAWMSFILGSALVLLIMVWIFRTSGVIAIGALVLNLTLMLAVLAFFGATLTLPGIAALVLTVGMAVDANIIIFERIREELRLGKSVRGAVDAGFSRGFSAILDGQLTTAVAGYVLMQYGSGPIRGFAVMLLIGIACTLFTATWCSRLFFEYYIGRGKKNPVIGI